MTALRKEMLPTNIQATCRNAFSIGSKALSIYAPGDLCGNGVRLAITLPARKPGRVAFKYCHLPVILPLALSDCCV